MNNHIAQELIRIARSVIASFPDVPGFEPKHWRAIEKGLTTDLKNWQKKILSNPKLGFVFYTSRRTSSSLDAIKEIVSNSNSVDDAYRNLDRLVKDRLRIFGPSGPNPDQMPEKFERKLRQAVKDYTHEDLLAGLAAEGFGWDVDIYTTRINEFIKGVLDKNLDRGGMEVSVVIKTDFGDFDFIVPAKINYAVFKWDFSAQVWSLSFKKLEKEVLQSREFIAAYSNAYKREVERQRPQLEAKEEIQKAKLEKEEAARANENKRRELLRKYAPRTYRWTDEYGYLDQIYNLALSGKTGKFVLDGGSNLISETRHWAEYERYKVTIDIGRAKSDSIEDLLDDSRFNPQYYKGDTYGLEV